MKYRVTTDRLEIEKLIEDTYLKSQQDKWYVYIDYADIRTIKKNSTFKFAIICDIDKQDKDWKDELLKTIESVQMPHSSLKTYVLNFIEGGNVMTITPNDVSNIRNSLISFKSNDNGINGPIPKNICSIWSARGSSSIPNNTLQIQLLSAYEKREEDEKEDEKYEKIIEQYRELFIHPTDFPEFTLKTSNKTL